MSSVGDDLVGVVIVDDHQMFAQSLARVLGDEPGIAVLGVGSHRDEALRLVEERTPRVLLVDYQMPGANGVEIAAEIKQRWPDTMIVMITGNADDEVLLSAIEAGCSGFLTKDRAASDVADAVRVAAAGEALISPSQLVRLLPKLGRSFRPAGADLTARELEVLNLLVTGASNKAIATELFLSVNTIRNYVQSILAKLDAHSKLEAVSIAVKQGIVAYPSRSAP